MCVYVCVGGCACGGVCVCVCVCVCVMGGERVTTEPEDSQT